MDPFGLINCLFDEPLRYTIRIDVATNAVSILDVLRAITGCQSKDGAIAFRRMTVHLQVPWERIRINNQGKPTPVAGTQALLMIIWAIPGKKAEIFRSNMLERMKQLTPDGRPFDFGELQFGRVTFTPPNKGRDVLMIGNMKFTVPLENDLPEVKEQFIRLTTKAENVYVQEQQKKSDLRIFKDVCAAGTSVTENQFDIMSQVHSIANSVRNRTVKPHRSTVQAREVAIKEKPCSLATCRLEHVYIVSQQGTNLYKIGFSERPYKRLATLQTANPFKLDLLRVYHGTLQDEQFLHRVYKQYQTSASNEWFSFKDGECFLI